MDGRGGPPGTPAALYAAETWSEPAFTLLSADPVAGAAAVTLGRELLLAGEGDAGLAHLHGLRVAPVAGHLGREHPRRGVRDAPSARPPPPRGWGPPSPAPRSSGRTRGRPGSRRGPRSGRACRGPPGIRRGPAP